MAEGSWVDVAAADDVAPAAVVAVEVGEVELALWRTADGVLSACDARCRTSMYSLSAVSGSDTPRRPSPHGTGGALVFRLPRLLS